MVIFLDHIKVIADSVYPNHPLFWCLSSIYLLLVIPHLLHVAWPFFVLQFVFSFSVVSAARRALSLFCVRVSPPLIDELL